MRAMTVTPRADGIAPTLTDKLRDEWGHLRTRPDLASRVSSWQLPLGPRHVAEGRAGLDAVLASAGFEGRRDDEQADRCLAALVAAAAADELADRVVLQRILPGLVNIAHRRGPVAGGVRRAFDELAGTAWLVIRTYPIDRRPARVAANLLRDIEYRAFVREPRLVIHQREQPTECHRLPDVAEQPCAEPFVELVALLAEGVRAGLSAQDQSVLCEAVSSESPRASSRRLGISERSWRTWRVASAARLRRLVEESAGDGAAEPT